MGVRWSDYSVKTHMGIVIEVCNSTREHGFHCAPLKRTLSSWSEHQEQTGPGVCLRGEPSPPGSEGKSDLFQGRLCWTIWFLRSRFFWDEEFNPTRKTIRREKRHPQFDVSAPLYCQYFDVFHDSLIIRRKPRQEFNCDMRNYTFSRTDAGTKPGLCC